MKSRKFMNITAVAVFTALAVSVWLSAQDSQDRHGGVRYSLKILGTLGNTFDSEAHGLNNRGSVPGQSFLPSGALHAFFWRKGVMTDLGTLGGPDSFVLVANHTISEKDVVVGYSETSTPDPNAENFCNNAPIFAHNLTCLAFVAEKGVMTPLPTLGGTNATAAGINNRGQVVGVAETPDSDPCSPFALQVEAVIWQDGRIQQILSPFGGSVAAGNAINDNGDVVGLSGCVTSNVYAVLWRHGKPINLGTLGGAFGNIPFDINNEGQVVGQSDLLGDTFHHGFFWEKGAMTDVGSLPGLPTSIAQGVNNQGKVVGFSQDANGDDVSSVAFLWQNGVLTDLNTLIPVGSPLFLMEAVAINDRGQIAGWGRLSNGDIRPFLLTPCDHYQATINACADRSAFVTQDETYQSPIDFPESASKLVPRPLSAWYSSVGVAPPI